MWRVVWQVGLRALAATQELVTRSLQHRVHVIPPLQHAKALRQICSRCGCPASYLCT